MDAQQLKNQRRLLGIAGHVLCAKVGISRSRLSDIERGYVIPTEEELGRLCDALESLAAAREKVAAVAAEVGYPL